MKIGYSKQKDKYYAAEYSKHPEVQKVTIVKYFDTWRQAEAWMFENSI